MNCGGGDFMAKRAAERPHWITLRDALATFVASNETQSQRHIKPLHWYVACRLVLEGGFDPDCISPRPPFKIERVGGTGTFRLSHEPQLARSREMTVLGGLKTKNVDVVVTQPNIGPCLAISMKGTFNAFRNLTNRMEEAAGDCTNIHMSYPTLVYGFWSILRGNRAGIAPADTPSNLKSKLTDDGRYQEPDVAITETGDAAVSIRRYHFALEGISGRSSLREEPSKYEAVGVTLVETDEDRLGKVFTGFPHPEQGLSYQRMFKSLYKQYDLRYVYQAPDLAKRGTRRLLWAADSPALANDSANLDYFARLGDPELEDEEGIESVEPGAREIERRGIADQ
jgi:hypothetical protein